MPSWPRAERPRRRAIRRADVDALAIALALWRGAGHLAAPAVAAYLRRRAARGREDAARLPERFGHASAPRPKGPLVWLHAASVGEATSVLPLLRRLLDERPDAHALITSGTVTSARLIARELPPRALHQFAPVDLPGPVDRFIAHWHPNLVLWTESEFWPGLLDAAARAAPLALLQGRVSEASFARWRRLKPVIAALLRRFTLVLAQSEADAERLRALGAATARCLGNLKRAAPPLPVDETELARLRARLGNRPRWLAASTHPGEEDAAADTHAALARREPELLTLVVPRHAERGPEIAADLKARGLSVGLRSAGDEPDPATAVYVADTMGELGLWYRLVDLAFIGGSLIPHGGQNLAEAARLGCAVLHGPSMANFAEIAAELAAAGGAREIADAAALARALERLLFDDPAARTRMAEAARAWAAADDQVVERALAALRPLLPGG